MINRIYLIFTLAITALFTHPPAWAEQAKNQPQITLEKAFFVDPTGILSVQDLQVQKFIPLESQTFSRGYTEEVSWLRLRIKTKTPLNSPIAIRIQPHFLDQIYFYEMTPRGWIKQVAGDQIPYAKQHNDVGSYKFIINPSATEDTTYYLRLKTSSLTFISIEAMTLEQAHEAALGDSWYYGLQCGVLALFFLWGITNYFSSKDLTFAIFSVFQITVLLFNMSAWGTFAYLLSTSPSIDDFGFSMLYILRILTTIWLGWSFLRTYEYPRWFKKIAYGYSAISMCEIFLVLSGHVQFALISNSILAFSIPIWQIWATIRTNNILPVISRMIIIGYSTIFCLLFYIFLSTSGLIHVGNQPMAITRWIGHINGFIFFLIVWKNNLINQNISSQYSTSLQVLQAKSVMEKKQLQERSTLIDMLVHELKNPLATIKMAAGSLKVGLQSNQVDENKRLTNINHSVDNMNTVIERCLLVDQIDQDRLFVRNQPIELKGFISEQLSKTSYQGMVFLQDNQEIEVRTDPFLLSIALGNLLDNAVKYCALSSPIKVKVSQVQSDSAILLSIAISNEIGLSGCPDPDQIFTRYYRNPYAQNHSGTGLGLYLTKSICEALGGNIVFEKLDNIVVFTIKIPIGGGESLSHSDSSDSIIPS